MTKIQNQTVSASGIIRYSSHELLRRRNQEAGESDPGYRCEADAIMSANSKAQKGQADYEAASTGWENTGLFDEILKLSREGKQQEASNGMTGEVYEEYKAFAEKLTILRDEFQAELDRGKRPWLMYAM